MTNKLIALVGPTGSGKTGWAKEISKKFNLPVISVDSRQIFRGMDIGTGKDKSFPQKLIDIIEPDKIFSVAEYQKKANDLIFKYQQKNIVPMLVGGTALYLNAVLYGYELPNLQKESLDLRVKLEKKTDIALYQELLKIDPASAKAIDPKNKRRVIRALEVTILSNEPFSAQQKKKKPLFDTLIIGIKIDRETLYSKIDARVDQMIKDGLVEEVRTLTKQYGYYKQSFNTIGYKEIIDYLLEKMTLKDAIIKIKTNTHSYVRRQETWWRRDKNIRWINDSADAEKLIQKFLNT